MHTSRGSKDWADHERPWRVAQEERPSVIAAWTAMGEREHASVGFFSRAILELLALGAPSKLVERTSSAVSDEIRHARQAFGLASSYAGATIGPPDLGVSTATTVETAAVLERWIDRVCIEHTTRALASSVAGQHVRDPAVRNVMTGMAEDDSCHADLGWRVVAWLLATFGEAARGPGRAILSVLAAAEAPASVVRFEPGLRHGVVSDGMFARMRAHVVGSIVVPTLRTHLNRSESAQNAA